MLRFGIKEKVLQEIIELAIRYNLDKVILFGSRARGDYRRTSDIDLAVTGGDVAGFSVDVEEETSTLLKFDIVDMNSAVQPELKSPLNRKERCYMKKYDNFCAALENLKDIYNYEEPYENVVLTGLMALYEICFEQAWKAIKELLDNSGAPEAKTGSPKMILKTAYQMGMIQQEELWLDALQARNNVTHAYNKLIALDIVHSVKTLYYNMFIELKNEIEKNWL